MSKHERGDHRSSSHDHSGSSPSSHDHSGSISSGHDHGDHRSSSHDHSLASSYHGDSSGSSCSTPSAPGAGDDNESTSVAAGTGLLTTTTPTGSVTTPVVGPITLPTTDSLLIDNEGGVVIAGADANYGIVELGAGATITLGNGNDRIIDNAGTATISLGNGNDVVKVAGGSNVVTVGDGANTIEVAGAGNTITTGNGVNHIELGGSDCAIAPVTADTLMLGNGANFVEMHTSGNIVNAGTGSAVIDAVGGSNNTFVANMAGGSLTVGGFSLTNGDKLDLTQILVGTTLAPDLSDLSSYVNLTSIVDGNNPAWTDTVLTINGVMGTSTITLLNTGTVTLGALENSSLVLPLY